MSRAEDGAEQRRDRREVSPIEWVGNNNHMDGLALPQVENRGSVKTLARELMPLCAVLTGFLCHVLSSVCVDAQTPFYGAPVAFSLFNVLEGIAIRLDIIYISGSYRYG